MPRITGAIVIEQPVADVFDFVADARNEPVYNRQMLAVQMLTPGPVGVGSRFAATHRGRRRPMELETELTEFQRPRRLGPRPPRWPAGSVSGVLTFEPVGPAHPDALGLERPPDRASRERPHPWSRQSVHGRNGACWQGLKTTFSARGSGMQESQALESRPTRPSSRTQT